MRSSRTLPTLLTISLCMIGVAGHASAPAPAEVVPTTASAANAVMTAPVPFIANRGQIPDGTVRFYARTFAGTVFVTRDGGLVYAVPRRGNDNDRGATTLAFRESFGGTVAGEPHGANPSPVRVSSFKGADPSPWRSHLATFDAVDLGERFPAVRVSLRAAGNNVEKLFHVAPGGEVSAIDIAADGVDFVAVDDNAQLVLTTADSDVTFTAPVAYQLTDSSRQPVEVAYVLGDDHHYGFRVGDYDRSRELVIDPLLAATYLGGHNPNPPGNYDEDVVNGMVVYGGDVWVAGVTQSPDFPIHLGYDPTLPNAYPDGFITRMSGDLTTVIASTYIGTDGFDRVTDIARDSDGTIVVVGEAGYGFPVTPGAYTWNGSTTTGGGFVARFSADLSTLEASAVPTPADYPRALALGNGGIYFSGVTTSSAFPITPGAWMTTCCPLGGFGIPEADGFAGKVSSDLTTLDAMTYLGGDGPTAIAVAGDGSVYITDGFDYAISGCLAHFDGALTNRMSLVAYNNGVNNNTRTYFNDVAVGNDAVVVAGETYITDLPVTPGAFDTTCGTDGLCDGVGPLLVPRSDGFVAVYSLDLQTIRAMTYLGGSGEDRPNVVTLDDAGTMYVAGWTDSVNFPTTPGAFDETYNGGTADAFIAALDAGADSNLIFANGFETGDMTDWSGTNN